MWAYTVCYVAAIRVRTGLYGGFETNPEGS